MAKSVSGKFVLISNIILLLLGLILILIIIGTVPPPKSTEEPVDFKFITLNLTDIIEFRLDESTNFLLELKHYNGNVEDFSKLSRTFLLSQQNRILNFLINKGDLITVTFKLGLVDERKINYIFEDDFNANSQYFITWDNIIPANKYIGRNKLSFLALDSVTGETLTLDTNIQYSMITEDNNSVDLATAGYMYRADTTVSAKDYSFRTIPYGLALNTAIKIQEFNPIIVNNLSVSRIVALQYTGNKYILQSCCGVNGCPNGKSGNGNYTDLGITANDVCTAAQNI